PSASTMEAVNRNAPTPESDSGSAYGNRLYLRDRHS
ncbi:unnamed protein product, partial [marine sediment metagenome]